MTVTVRESLLTTISLIRFRTLPQESLIRIEMNHFPELTKAQIEHEIDRLVDDLTLVRNEGNLFLPYRPEEEIDPKYLAKADAYRAAHSPTRWQRIKGWLGLMWDRIWLPVAFVVVTSFFALGLCAQDIPDWCLRGIAKVETGSTWRDIGDLHYRDRRVGADGEVGPWQLSPAALKDMGVAHLCGRIHREPILAESMTRAWLLRCYRRTGDWFEAVAIYHTGPAGSRQRGNAYAARVRAVGAL